MTKITDKVINEDTKKSDRECYMCRATGISDNFKVTTLCGVYYICKDCSIDVESFILRKRV